MFRPFSQRLCHFTVSEEALQGFFCLLLIRICTSSKSVNDPSVLPAQKMYVFAHGSYEVNYCYLPLLDRRNSTAAAGRPADGSIGVRRRCVLAQSHWRARSVS